jgi:ABC-type Fe3+ transport system permease subunit
MIKPNLWQKLAVVTAALMLMCCMALLALQMRANTRHEQEVVQRLRWAWPNTSPSAAS